jgi:hypothetical protein
VAFPPGRQARILGRMRLSLFLGLALSLLGCSGLKFTDQPVNAPLPTELSQRRYFDAVGAYQRNLDALVGHILYARKSATGGCNVQNFDELALGRRQYLKAGTKLVPDNQAAPRYESKIESGMAASSQLFTFAAHFNADQRAEVSISDAVFLFIKDTEIPQDDLDKVADSPMADDECDRFYIRGVVLSVIQYKTYQRIDADATTSGNAFGASGKVFGEGKSFSLDLKLGVNLLPVRKEAGAGVQAQSTDPVLDRLRTVRVPATGFPERQE